MLSQCRAGFAKRLVLKNRTVQFIIDMTVNPQLVSKHFKENEVNNQVI